MYNFRNDYSFGAHPDVLAALTATNMEGIQGYGADPYCSRCAQLIREKCAAPQAEVHFLIGGTSTNLTALCAFLRPWESIISAHTAHINGHESGAVEATGHKILAAQAGADGKLTPDMILPFVDACQDAHLTKPRLVYISDATENGTVYTKAELTALRECCLAHDLLLFLDGARLGCALASDANDLTLADIAALTDAFYIGGTKNGALMGEALVITHPALQNEFFRVQKQRGAVLAKGWLLGVQFEALLKDDLYFTIARHANQLAARLQDGLEQLGYSLMVRSTTNQVFVVVENSRLDALSQLAVFETWCPIDKTHTAIRFVTSWGTPQAWVDGLLAALPRGDE